MEQRGLAGTVGTEQRDELASRRGEADPFDGANRAIGLDHVVEEERRRAFIRCHSSPSNSPLVA